MDYACYRTTSSQSKRFIRLNIGNDELLAMGFNEPPRGFSAKLSKDGSLVFREDGVIKLRDEVPDKLTKGKWSLLYSGTVEFVVPTCGMTYVEPRKLDDGPGFSFKPPTNPVKKIAKKRKDEYTLADLGNAISEVFQIASSLGVEVTIQEGKCYFSFSSKMEQ